MGGEHIEIDLNIIPSPRVFYFVHPDLIVVLRFCDLCVASSGSRETSMISRRIGWIGAGGRSRSCPRSRPCDLRRITTSPRAESPPFSGTPHCNGAGRPGGAVLLVAGCQCRPGSQ